MGVEGIGASVVRKEDRRFITGKGRYVDDIKLQGMTHAHFIRSPHAHAKVKSIDVVGGDEDAGRGRRADRPADRRRQGRQPDLRLGDHLQGRHADEDGRVAGDGAGDRALRRTGGRGGDCRDQEPGPRRRRSGRGRLRGAAGGGRYPRRDQAGRAAAASGSAGQRDLRLDHRRRGRDQGGVQTAANVVSLDITNNRLVPNAMEPRAAIARIRRRPKNILRSTPRRRIRMSRVWCCRRSTTSRRSTSCG